MLLRQLLHHRGNMLVLAGLLRSLHFLLAELLPDGGVMQLTLNSFVVEIVNAVASHVLHQSRRVGRGRRAPSP